MNKIHEAFNKIGLSKFRSKENKEAVSNYVELLKISSPEEVEEFNQIRKKEIEALLVNLSPLKSEQLTICEEDVKNYW